MKKDTEPSLASLLGTAFAYVQDGMDRAIEWGFSAMKDAGNAPKGTPMKEGNAYVRRLKRFGRLSLRFLGTAGDTYYRTYEDLKKRRKRS